MVKILSTWLLNDPMFQWFLTIDISTICTNFHFHRTISTFVFVCYSCHSTCSVPSYLPQTTEIKRIISIFYFYKKTSQKIRYENKCINITKCIKISHLSSLFIVLWSLSCILFRSWGLHMVLSINSF